MALARISKWLCGRADVDDNSALRTESKLSTENKLKVDPVKTDSRVKVDPVKTDNRLNVDTVKTENKLKIEKTSVDVNVNAPKKVKIEGPDPVTVKHQVDVIGPAFNTLSKPVVAIKNKFSRTPEAPEPPSTSTPPVLMSSNNSVSRVATKRSATIGSRA